MSTEPQEKEIEKLKAGIADSGHLVARVDLSLIPGFGGAAKELF